MSRFVNIQVTLLGFLIIMRIAGIGTGLDPLLAAVGLGCSPGTVGCTLGNSTFFNVFFNSTTGLFAIMIGIGIIATFVARANFDWVFLGGTAIVALNGFFLFGVFDNIINSVTGWGASAIYLFFALLGLLYIWSIFEFVMNR